MPTQEAKVHILGNYDKGHGYGVTLCGINVQWMDMAYWVGAADLILTDDTDGDCTCRRCLASQARSKKAKA